MKKCTKCGVEKDLKDFRNKGTRPSCKECDKKEAKTPINHIKQIYSNQKSNSISKGREAPNYTNDALIRWCWKQPLYHELHKAWVASNYNRLLAPSCDRINDYKPYTLDNLQLMTWNENKLKGESDRKNGVLITSQMRAVAQYKLDGTFIREYHSILEASRKIGIPHSCIVRCCKGDLNKSGGFKWKYKEIV